MLPLLKQQTPPRWLTRSGVPFAGLAIAAGGHLFRLVNPRPATGGERTSNINALEGFWGYLKVRLAAKGGIRRSQLPLYLAEYVWRYNHRRLSVEEQVKRLLRLLQR
ncbi:MAG TPA: hypothetical protein VLM91_13375 [Candidatus Methylomirabilis sp.]|nr:hypothetical protein [Candidatus Methylomirabilis sp.]